MNLVDALLPRPGCVIHYRRRDSTSGRWVVFLHGAGMDGHMFDAQVDALPDEVGVLCWDARGHGRSTLEGRFSYSAMLADLDALLTLTDGGEVILVGQSMGGNLAQSYLESAGADVVGVVLVDCTDNHGPLSRIDRFLLGSVPAVLLLYPWSLTVRQSAAACGTLPSTVDYVAQRLKATGRRRFSEVIGFWREALRPDAAWRSPVPVLAVLGAEDSTGNIAPAMRALADRDPAVRLEVLADASHNANMDRPDAFNALVREFLAGLATGG